MRDKARPADEVSTVAGTTMTTPSPFSSPLVPPPLDHGAVGNGRVLALVSPTSAIEWLCLPRFDSPSVFARLLDTERGGTFRLLYGDHEVRGHLRYIQNTNVLSTRFAADGNYRTGWQDGIALCRKK